MSTHSEAIPIKLPLPPSSPPSPCKCLKPDSIAARALSALKDDDDNTKSLDVHIRWKVASGSIVQTGEKIASLFYCFHGASPPPLTGSITSKISSSSSNTYGQNNVSGGGGNIRARAKKNRWAATSLAAAAAATSNNAISNNNAGGTALQKEDTTINNNFVTLEIRAPSNGFLRVLHKKPSVSNAVQYASEIKSVVSLILAAIEPCEHPAVVGGLCAVCGVDVTRGGVAKRAAAAASGGDGRTKNANASQLDNMHIPRKHDAHKENKTKRKRPAVDRTEQQILEKQKKLASSIESSREFQNTGGYNDEELANLDMHKLLFGMPKPPSSSKSDGDGIKNDNIPAALPPPPPPKPVTKPEPSKATPSTQMRSLSSLLSGAKATQKLQQTPEKQQPQSHHRPIINHQRQQHQKAMAAHHHRQTTEDNPKMSKVTVSGGVTITVSETEAAKISDASSKKLRSEKKLYLVLDLDHTLLHATDDYRAGRFVADEVPVGKDDDTGDDEKKTGDYNHDSNTTMTESNPNKRGDVRSILLPVELSPADQQMYIQNKLQQQKQDTAHKFCLSPIPQQRQGVNNFIVMRHFVKLRPHLKEFFNQISSTYQLSVYTAGTRAYAEQIAIMICRHLVGASLDEEGLNTLRAKIREKDDECRRYAAQVARKKQLEFAIARDDNVDDDDDDEVQVVDVKEDRPNACADSTTTDKVVNTTDEKTDNTSKSASMSSQKRSNSGKEDGEETKIPRKKKRVDFGSLLLPVSAAETASSNKSEKTSLVSEDLIDPSVERDRLRKELEEAEKLEIAAVELRRKIFGSRIVSRTDVGDLGKDVKSLKRVFPCGGLMVRHSSFYPCCYVFTKYSESWAAVHTLGIIQAAILDDREDVWANAKNNVTGRPGEPPDNLLLVKPYHWKPFQGYADVNNASGLDLSETKDSQQCEDNKPDNQEDDVQLLWTADILRRLHERYYSSALSEEEREGLSVPGLLQAMRKETFLRYPQVKVVFSGLIPISKQNSSSQIRPHVVRYAEELGAGVLPGITNEVTHVVAARDRSEKIRQARKEVPGCFIMHTSWLMECYWSITRRDVRPYHIGPVPATQLVRQQPEVSSRSTKNATILLDSDEEVSDDDESDDDFAAALENEMITSGK